MSWSHEYQYEMGFMVNNIPIPDPSEYSGSISDLDTSAERDANGLLHRTRVATKHPLKMVYKALDWEMIMHICSLMKDESFQFTYPDPRTGELTTATCYVGNRDWNAKWYTAEGTRLGNLNFSGIEY